MRNRWIIAGSIMTTIILVAWGLAYWFIGADVKFLGGLIRSRRAVNTNVMVLNSNSSEINQNTSFANTNQPQRTFTGFKQTTVVSDFTKPTRMSFEPGSDDLIVSELGGAIWRVRLDGTKQLVASGFSQLLGISLVADIGVATLYVASKGMVSLLTRQDDGTYGDRRDIVTNLPAGRHQTDLALIGPDGRLYIATGSRSDRGETAIDPREAAVLVADPDGGNVRVFATGLRNPYGMAFDGERLLVSDNGQDVPSNGVPEEINLVTEGKDYGWTGCWGIGQGPECDGTVSPQAVLQEHSSANGFAIYDGSQFPDEYVGDIFIALWGSNSQDPEIGKRVQRVKVGDVTPWPASDFVIGLNHPIDVKVDPRDGTLLILDFGSGQVIRVTAEYQAG